MILRGNHTNTLAIKHWSVPVSQHAKYHLNLNKMQRNNCISDTHWLCIKMDEHLLLRMQDVTHGNQCPSAWLQSQGFTRIFCFSVSRFLKLFGCCYKFDAAQKCACLATCPKVQWREPIVNVISYGRLKMSAVRKVNEDKKDQKKQRKESRQELWRLKSQSCRSCTKRVLILKKGSITLKVFWRRHGRLHPMLTCSFFRGIQTLKSIF